MKILLLTVACFAVALAAPAQKQKRDILPGDPRYGTDYHHQHHHAHHGNEVEVTQSNGGYVGSYIVPENSQASSYNQPQTVYGPPQYQPGKPINDYLPPVAEVTQPAPVPTYGVPAVQVPQQLPVVEVGKTTVSVPAPTYGIPSVQVPVVESVQTTVNVPAPTYVPSHQVSHQTQVVEAAKTTESLPAVSYGVPSTYATQEVQTAVEEVQNAVHVPAPSYGTPVNHVQSTAHAESVSDSYGAPAVQHASKTIEKPVTSYGVPTVEDKAIEHVETPVTSYKIPAVQRQQTFNSDASAHVKTVQHNHVAHQQQQPVRVPQQHYIPQAQTSNSGHYSGSAGYTKNVQASQGSYTTGYQSSTVNGGHVHVPTPQVQIPSFTVHHNAEVQRLYQPVVIPQQVHVQHELRTPVVQHVETQKQIQLPSFIQDGLSNFQVPSFIQDTFSNFQLPQLPQFPSLPSFPSFGNGGQTTLSEVASIPTSIPSVETTDTELVNVQSVKSSAPVARHEYVQPTDANGGYVY